MINKFSSSAPKETYREHYREYACWCQDINSWSNFFYCIILRVSEGELVLHQAEVWDSVDDHVTNYFIFFTLLYDDNIPFFFRARYSYDQVSVGNDTMEYPPSRHINTTLASKLCLITYFGFLSDKAIFNWAFKAILDCFGWFYSVMRLFQKIHITFWTNQMQNLNQSQLGHSPSPALSAVWYFPCYDWLFWLFWFWSFII